MAEIHFKTFSPLAAASASVVITAQSAPTGVVRSQVARRGAAIRGVLSVQWSTCHSSPQEVGSAGEWPATTAAPAKAGALTRLLSVCANRFRVSHRLLDLEGRRLQGRVRRSRQISTVALVADASRFIGTPPYPPFRQARKLHRLYCTSPEPVIAKQNCRASASDAAFHSKALQQFANERFFFLQFRH